MRKANWEPPRCSCTAFSGGPSTHRGARHRVWLRQQHEPRCKHSNLERTTKPYRPHVIKHVRGTRRLIAVLVSKPKTKRRKKKA